MVNPPSTLLAQGVHVGSMLGVTRLTNALQELLSGPHTLVRVDHTSAGSSPGSDRKSGGRGAARQTGLNKFYKSAHTLAVLAWLRLAIDVLAQDF